MMHPELITVLHKYCSLAPIKSISFPNSAKLRELQDFLLDNILLDPHLQRYPPSQQYQKIFWKWSIGELEKRLITEEDEIDERILEKYMSLLAPDTPSVVGGLPSMVQAPKQSFVTRFWRWPNAKNEEEFLRTTLLEARTTIEAGTTGMRSWLASFVLAQYFLLNGDIVSRSRVLELGSGTGLLGIIVASIQKENSAGALWLTDIDDVLLRCRDNVQLPCNSLTDHRRVYYSVLDWNLALEPNISAKDLLPSADPELIIGADLVFDPLLVPSLVSTVAKFLQPTPSQASKSAIIALTLRIEKTMEYFLQTTQDFGLDIQEITNGPESLDSTVYDTVEGIPRGDKIKIFKIMAKPGTVQNMLLHPSHKW